MPPSAEIDPAQRTAGAAEFGLAGAVVVGTLLVVTPNALANDTSSAEIEKQALAAFGADAVTRTIESFPKPAPLEATSVSDVLGPIAMAEEEDDLVSHPIGPPDESTPPTTETPPPEEVPPPEETPPEEVPPDSAAELKKACVDAGLADPETLSSRMIRPGLLWKGPSQLVEGKFLFDLVPKFCKDKFRRFASFLVQIKDKGRNIWRNMTNSGKKRWESLQIDEAHEYTEQEGKALAELSIYPAGHGGLSTDPDSYYFNKTCRPVRTFLRYKVVKDKPRKVHDFPGQPGLYRWVYPLVGQKIKKIAVEVLGKCARKKK